MHNAIAECQSLGLVSGQTYYYGLIAQIYLERGMSAPGLKVIQTALEIVHTYGDRHYEAELHRLRGELLLLGDGNRANDKVQAETAFQRARQIAQGQGAKSLELRAAMSLGRFWQKQGKDREAHELLATVYNWFTEGFDTPDLQEAKQQFAQLSSQLTEHE